MNRSTRSHPSSVRSIALSIIGLIFCAAIASAQQRVQFPNPQNIFPGTQPAVPPTGMAVPPTISPIPGPVITDTPLVSPTAPGTSATPWTQVPGSAVLGTQIQPFDPYGLTGSSGPTVPGPGNPVVPVPPPPAPNYGVQPPPLGQPYEPPQALQIAPVFPEGISQRLGTQTLFQDTGMLYTYLYGESDDDLQMHEAALFTSAIFENFLGSPYSLRVTPGFAFHFLDGPGVPGKIDLPAKLYSAYLNFLYQPQITPQFGADLNFRVGVFSDFDSVTWHSMRFMGRGLGVVQLTPNTVFKLGVEYIDRADLKLFPAGGILWTPNPETRFDIYFPRPRVSKYWTTWGNNEIWWHIGGEYGGGSWTIDRISDPSIGANDRIDINDIRVFAGFDWNRMDRVDGLFEVGYVFDRKVFTKRFPSERLGLDDTFMIRAGVKF